MVSVLDIDVKVRGFITRQNITIFKGDKIRGTSFGGEIRPSVPCRNILQQVK